ncbi:MAG TPA: carboxypeptidase regulatory-like domain-containing protein [Thermoanaerobaculia bacterium]|nr:carboxypeptidase regulatory-like domain-containing protein [Thermoanaerobaculia bacterium]
MGARPGRDSHEPRATSIDIMILTPLLFWAAAAATSGHTHSVKGVVIDAKSHAPIYGATIATQSGKRLAVSDKSGHFKIALSEEAWPSTLLMGAPGHAPKSAQLPHVPADADLKTISLSAAARLHIVVPPAYATDRLHWRLVRTVGQRPVEIVKEGSFATGVPETTIDDLPSANYLVSLRGERPLQQLAVPATTSEGDTSEVVLNIVPLFLKLKVQSGERPYPGAIVRFIQHDQEWAGTVRCDDNGSASEEMWQGGDYFAALIDNGQMLFARSAHLQSDTGTVTWTFDVPSHRVKGRVIDAETQQALPGVELTLFGTAPREGGLEGVKTMTDADGHFEFGAVQEGSHSLRAYLKGYRYDQLQHFEIGKDDDDYQTDILLERTVDSHALVAVNSAGAPIAGADVFLAGDSGIDVLESTDDTGRVTLPPHHPGVVFVIPPEGSFGFTRVSADLSDDVILHVPPGVGSLEVISQSTAGEAIPGVFFLMRVNGTMIPPAVFGRFANRHGLSFRTDVSGHAFLQLLPQGLYEFWPVRSDGDVMALLSGNPPEPAAAVSLNSVPQVITMTFKPKPSG